MASSVILFNNTVLQSNKAGTGGGFALRGSVKAVYAFGAIVNNTAKVGAGVYCGESQLNLTASVVANNSVAAQQDIFCDASTSR